MKNKRLIGFSLMFMLVLILLLVLNSNNEEREVIEVIHKQAKIDYFLENESSSIKFKDAHLYKKICNELNGKVEFSHNDEKLSIQIKNRDIQLIKSLDLSNSEINSISGIEHFTWLEELNINSNSIKDIKEVAHLTNLIRFSAYSNDISDCSPISNLIGLKYLNLGKNQLDDLNRTNDTCITSNVSKLINLQELNLSHNYLKYTEGLEKLTNLKKLDLYDNAICDLSGLGMQQKLQKLNLGQNNEVQTHDIKNIDNLNKLTDIVYFNFSENNTTNILKYIPNLTKLEELQLEKNKISDISDIDRYKNLKVLNLQNNSIKTITSVFALTNIEEIYLGINEIETLQGIYDKNGENVFPKLKKVDISDNKLIYTMKDNENDSSRISVNSGIILNINNDGVEVNYEYLTDTSSLPHTDSKGIKYVNYDDFGAKCNGVYDDFIAIRNAHIYANLEGCEVRATKGKTYHIYNYYGNSATIKTNVDWCDANFVIHDEKIENVSGKNRSIFNVINVNTGKTIKNPEWTINTKTRKINEIKDILNSMNQMGYTKYLCVAQNSNKKQFIRFGSNANSGDNQKDVFCIDSNGNILNDIQWNFDKITSFTIYPVTMSNMSIKNGNFITNNLETLSNTTIIKNGNTKKKYYYRNIYFDTVTNLEVSNINHSIKIDKLSGAYLGFLQMKTGYNINVNNCSLYSRINERSTYELQMTEIINSKFENITSNYIDEDRRWGIVATNYCKDILFENCALNRIDAHCGIYNLTVKDCNIGCKGITVSGQGKLNVINTAIESKSFITLRRDYGSTWNGDVNIINCTYKFPSNKTAIPKIIEFYTETEENGTIHDFGYFCRFPNVYVKDLTIDNENNSRYNYVLIIQNTEQSGASIRPNSYWPSNIYINGYKTINNAMQNPYIRILYNESENINGNYLITDVTLKLRNPIEKDVTDKFDAGEYITAYDGETLNLKINPTTSSTNMVSIYRDNELLENRGVITEEYNFDFEEVGKYKIILNSEENIYSKIGVKEYEFEIKPVSKIEINNNPRKLKYIQNYENLDVSAGTILAIYDDVKKEEIPMTSSDVVITGFDNSKLGFQTIKLSYKGKEVTFVVEVVEKEISSISIGNLPTKTQYILNEELDLTDGTIIIKYNDNSKKTIYMTQSDVEIAKFDNTTLGEKKITLKYKEFTTEFKVEFKNKESNEELEERIIEKIEVTKVPDKITYIQNYEKMDFTKGEITVKYLDGTSEIISMTSPEIIVTGFDNSTTGLKEISLEYKGKIAKFNVLIEEKTIEKIEVKEEIYKKEYNQNDKIINREGGKLLIIYNDKTTEEILMTNEDVIIKTIDTSIEGKKAIEVKYKEKTTTFVITVKHIENLNSIGTETLEELPNTGINNWMIAIIIISVIICIICGKQYIQYKRNTYRQI